MNKVWFFVEGYSEENLVNNLIRLNYPDVVIELDELRFITDDYDRNSCYCLNAADVNKIPYELNEYYYKINRSGSRQVVVICDVEKLRCNSSRRAEIEIRLNDDVKHLNIRYVFFNPMIERLYLDCPPILIRVFEIMYKRTFGNEIPVPNIELPADDRKCQYTLKKIFKNHSLKYRKRIFSAEFFSRVDYARCDNDVIARLTNFMDTVFRCAV